MIPFMWVRNVLINTVKFTQILDFYLSAKGKAYLPEINRLAKLNTPEADEALSRYVLEAIRLNGTYGAYREAQREVTVNDGGNEIRVNKGSKVFVSFVSASRDPAVFPEPEKILLDRPLDSYVHFGIGPHTCLGQDASRVALTAMLRVVGALDNLRPARGTQGVLKKIPRAGNYYMYMREDGGSYTPFPASKFYRSPSTETPANNIAAFKVEYDSELPALKSRGTW
jgi:linoleate 10R-lipoxygenase